MQHATSTQRGWIATLAVAASILLIGCSTPSLGRMQPFLGEVDACAEIAREMELTNRFCDHAREHTDYDKGSAVALAVASALILAASPQIFGASPQADEIQELHSAWKSAIVRRHGLEMAFAEQSCSIAKPEWRCPRPCGNNRFFRWLDADPESCVAFSNKEVRKYGFVQCTNNRGEPVACPGAQGRVE